MLDFDGFSRDFTHFRVLVWVVTPCILKNSTGTDLTRTLEKWTGTTPGWFCLTHPLFKWREINLKRRVWISNFGGLYTNHHEMKWCSRGKSATVLSRDCLPSFLLGLLRAETLAYHWGRYAFDRGERWSCLAHSKNYPTKIFSKVYMSVTTGKFFVGRSRVIMLRILGGVRVWLAEINQGLKRQKWCMNIHAFKQWSQPETDWTKIVTCYAVKFLCESSMR